MFELLQNGRRRHEVRDNTGHLVAVIEIIDRPIAGPAASMVELSADVGGAAYRVRLFPPSPEDDLAAPLRRIAARV